MLQTAEKIREIGGLDARALPEGLLESTEPVVLRGLVTHWPMVRAARESEQAAIRYLGGFCRDATVGAMLGEPDIDGRFFYNEDLSGFNFRSARLRLDSVLEDLGRYATSAHPPSIYVGSTTIDTALPGFREHNDIDLGGRNALASIWIGNRARIAAHHDLPDNLACVVAGHRRFTLFPPEQIANLYVGPLDLTPAGQAISLVDFARPDYARFPRFAQAAQAARVAELAPGDAVFIPSMWWHHIESLDSFNALVNYWWRQSPAYMDAPIGALMLAIMTVRDLPPAQRTSWQNLFQHYVFDADANTTAHIPEHSRRSLGPLTDEMVRDMRARLIARLNR
jgi:hypothetical protein